MRWIDATDLKLWARRRDCQENLPLLVRRLIRAHATEIKNIKFPAGDNILIGGWDGILESDEDNEYIPKGISVWEFGSNIDKKGKANKDYEKRTKDPLGINAKNSTYIFVTPLIWQNSEEWCQEKIAEGKWKEIRIYDAEILEEWLEISPTVGAWLAKIIGKYPQDNVQPTEDFWEEWTSGSKFNLSAELVTAGRHKEMESLVENLNNPPNIITIQSTSRDESLAFAIGAIKITSGKVAEDFFSRSIIVDGTSTFRIISANNKKLILIVRFEDEGIINMAVSKGHHVIIPLGADSTYQSSCSILLPRLDREGFVKALIDIGITDEEAKEYSKESSRNLTIFRRQHNFQRNQPLWAKPDNAMDLIPVLLAGRWDENKEGDREVLSKLAGEPYEAYAKKLSKWINVQDSPLYRIGGKWRLASPIDAWSYLSAYLTKSHLEELKVQFLSLLKEIHPEFELETEKRGMAAIYGKSSKYTSTLKEGLCQSLILISIYGEDFKVPLQIGSQIWCDSIIDELLKDASKNLWCSLNYYLPLIAEASPSALLDRIDKALTESPSPVLGMFDEFDNFLTPRSYHTGLLWALEGLAWFPIYISRVVILLGRLAKDDPGGRLSNRPINSLRSIFLPWQPNTYCSLNERFDVLTKLINENPDVAWELLLSILPKYHDVGWPAQKTRWRKYQATYKDNVTYKDIWDCHSFTFDSLILLSRFEENKLAELVKHIDMLAPKDRAKILDYLRDHCKSIRQVTFQIWNNLRELLFRHRSHLKTKWALPTVELDEIEVIYNLLEPNSIMDKYKWLFEKQYPQFPTGIDHDRIKHAEHERIIVERRKEAFNEIYNIYGLEGIIELARNLSDKRFIGDIAGYEVNSQEETEKILSLVQKEDEGLLAFVKSFVFRKYALEEISSLGKIYSYLITNSFTNKTIADLFVPLIQSAELWDFIKNTNSEIDKEYWTNCYAQFFNLSIDYKIYGIKKLLEMKRFFTALDFVAIVVKEFPTDLLLDILFKVVREPANEKVQLQGYEFETLFIELDNRTDVDIKNMTQLEWEYLPILTRHGIERRPKYLEEELSSNPTFFVEVLTWIYKPHNDNEEIKVEEVTQDEMSIRRAEMCYTFLQSWEKVPGIDLEGTINYETLDDWISNVRNLAVKANRINIADYHIGKLLSGPPQDIDFWLQESICKILDKFNNEDINEGFCSGVFNKRGVVQKAYLEGGRQEKEIAELFLQKSREIAINFPITSSLLLKIAKRYEDDAKRENERSELEDLEY